MNRLFVTGIGTGVGKTIVSAVLAEALEVDYWKPIQAGDLQKTDSAIVRSLLSNQRSTCHPEAFRLSTAASPHAAARLDGMSIRLEDIIVPSVSQPLIIEGAGGVLSPLNDSSTMADLIRHCRADAILVSRHYLGSINHTLLSLEALLSRSLPVRGIVFVGDENKATETFILDHGNVPFLGRIREESRLTKDVIVSYSHHFRSILRDPQ